MQDGLILRLLPDTFCHEYQLVSTVPPGSLWRPLTAHHSPITTFDFCPGVWQNPAPLRPCSSVDRALASEAMCPRSSRGKGTFSTIAALIQGAQLAGAASVFITGGSFYCRTYAKVHNDRRLSPSIEPVEIGFGKLSLRKS